MMRWRSLWRWVAGGFAAIVLLLGLATGLFRLLVPTLPQYEHEIEAWASDALKVPVTLGSYDLRWTLEGPQLVFFDAELWTPDRSERVLHADGGAVRVSLIDLVRGKLRLSRLMLRGAQIEIDRDAAGEWRVLGRELPAMSGAGATSVLPRGELELRDATVIVSDGQEPPLRLSGVRFSFERGSDYLRLDGALDLPERSDGHLEVVVQTDAGQLERWQLYVRGERLDLTLLDRVAPALRGRLRGGYADLTLWSWLRGRRLDEGSLVLDAHDVLLGDGPATGQSMAAPAVAYETLGGRFEWNRLPGGWRVKGEGVQLAHGAHQWPGSSFRVDLNDGGGLDALQAEYLRLEDLTPLLAWLPDGDARTRAIGLDAHGELSDVAFQRVGTGSDVKLSGYFTDLGFQPVGGVPGASGLTGNVRMDEDGGRLELASSHVVTEWPSIFRAPLPEAELRGALSWQRQPEGWRVLSEELLLATDDMRSRAQLELKLPADGSSPLIDLQLAMEDADIAAASRYLPARRMPAKVVDWLDAALRSGRVASATVSLIGPIRAFPFDAKEGDFRARLQIENATLAYWPEWPVVESMNGTVEFHDASLSGQMREAVVGGNRVAPALVNIADLREGVIEYTGHSSGDVDAVLGYLRTSGLAKRSAMLEHGLEASGPGELDLDFSLPVRRLDGTRVRATLHVDGGTVGIAGLRQRFEGVQGAVEYGDEGLRADKLKALFLGRPVEAALTPQRADDGHVAATQLDIDGRFDGIDFGAGLDERLGKLLAGSSMYHARARLPRDGSGFEIDVRSDLVGTELRMPAPLAKASDAPAALAVHTRFPAPDNALIEVRLGEGQRALFEAARDAHGWRFRRGSVELSGETPQLVEAQGLAVRGQVAVLDFQRWLDFDMHGPVGGEPLLSFLDLRIDDLHAFDQRFPHVHTQVDRNDREWLVQLDGADLRGSLFVPLDARSTTPLVAKLDALHLTSDDNPGKPADPRTLRAMQIEVGDFAYNTMHFGRLTLDLAPVASGVRVTKLETTAPSFTLAGSGQWLLTDFGHQSTLDFKLHSTDVAATLAALDFDSSLSASDADVSASVSWPGAPGPRFKEQLTGDVKIHVGSGQLTSVEPGAGRMFGLLSVAALPRRLSLDFRDVFEKGLAFDEIHGDFTLDGGNAYTNNLALEGPAADVGIVGRTGLVTKDYDQNAMVYANFGATLPVAGVLAGGPVGGAAMLLFSQIFKKPLKNMMGAHYRISGSWDQPVVERVTTESENAEGARNARAPGAQQPLAEDHR
jgi:uncharacterized protein (TIGR02099 family)